MSAPYALHTRVQILRGHMSDTTGENRLYPRCSPHLGCDCSKLPLALLNWPLLAAAPHLLVLFPAPGKSGQHATQVSERYRLGSAGLVWLYLMQAAEQMQCAVLSAVA
jgi:hypothetical protein